MKGRDAVMLNWKAPPEWDRFLDAVAEENRGYTSPYAGLAIEKAWDEYRDDHALEEHANRLLDAAGLSRSAWEEKNPPRREAGSGDGRASVRVLAEVKEEMGAFADETGVPKHEVLRAVVNWYLAGGVLGRSTEKLERAVPDAVEALESRTGESSLGPVERRTISICQRLGDEFTQSDLVDAIEAEGLHSDQTIEKYTERVLDRLNYEPHPNCPHLYIPAEEREQLARREAEKRRQAAAAEADERFDQQSVSRAVTDGGQEVER